MTNSIEALRDFALNEVNNGDLRGYAANEAAKTLIENWDAALKDGTKHDLVRDVDLVIERLQMFRTQARRLLPVSNGGMDGLMPEQWKARLAEKDVEIYPCPNHRFGYFGYTNCDAADYPSEEEAIEAAVEQHFG